MSVIVECVATGLAEVPEEFLFPRNGLTRDRTFRLTIGRHYRVDAITSWYGGFWFYLIDDDDLRYPTWHPSAIFKMVGSAIPSDWVIGQTVLSYPEWANDRHYYERLVDGDPVAAAQFRRQRGELAIVVREYLFTMPYEFVAANARLTPEELLSGYYDGWISDRTVVSLALDMFKRGNVEVEDLALLLSDSYGEVPRIMRQLVEQGKVDPAKGTGDAWMSLALDWVRANPGDFDNPAQTSDIVRALFGADVETGEMSADPR